jgi:hypothetical protein
LPALAKAGQNEQRLSCVNNLKQVGAAYRLWAGDHGGKVPAQQTVGNGGYLDAVFGPAVTSQMTMASISTNYNLLAGALGNSTKLLVCPADDRSAAFIFPILNTACSYFVGVGANDNYPQSIEGGDRNMGIVGDPSYGFSGTPSYMGAGDMVLNLGTNGGSASVNSGKPAMITTSTTGAIGWSLKLHSASSATGAGNLLLGDGSVQQASTSALNIYLNSASDSGNFYSASALSTSQYARYLFP